MNGEPSQSPQPVANHSLLSQGVALHQEGHLDEAAKIYSQVLWEAPTDFDATHLLGVIALQQGRFDAAQQLINAAVAIRPHDVSAVGNLGTSYMRDGKLEAALHWFQTALELEPESSTALTNIGTALHNMGRHAEALPILQRARAADPSSYTVCNLLGVCLDKCGRGAEAADVFAAATEVDPGNAEGWVNLSVALNSAANPSEARECAVKAVALDPQSPAALVALGTALVDLSRVADAIEIYRRAVALPPPSAKTLYDFANILLASGLNEEAIEQLQRGAQLAETNLSFRWAAAIALIKPIYASEAEVILSRRQFAQALDAVETWYRNTDGVPQPYSVVGAIQPFYLAYQPFNNRDLLSRYGTLCAEWMRTMPAAAGDVRGTVGPGNSSRKRTAKIRVGIASAHIREHSVWDAITRGWVYNFDPEKFELYLFQLKPDSDAETRRVKGVVAGFEDQPTSLAEWVDSIRSKDLDVLIYPEIGMHPLTAQLASLRLAPVQAATWGHPESTGLPTMDLFISGDALEPAEASANYRERLVRLPNLGVHVKPVEPATLKPRLRSLDLPTNEPLLLCPGSPFKYSPADDQVWIQIAQQLVKTAFRRSSGGRLVFFCSRLDAMDRMLQKRLRTAFEKADVDFDSHVTIIPNLDRARFFGLMRESALMLDTLEFSGFNTAIQGIECGLPVLAYEGKFMRGRLASAIMRRLDLPELVATTKEEFVRKAIELAGDPKQRRRLQAKITERRHVLFNDTEPVRALERALTEEVREAGAR